LGRKPHRARRARRRAARDRAGGDALRGADRARRSSDDGERRMKLAIVSDAWTPQVNGVVTTLVDLRDRLALAGHRVEVIEPSAFRRLRCPGYAEIELAWRPGAAVARRLDALEPDAIHIATEGPLGLAARAHCLRSGLPFTTAFH